MLSLPIRRRGSGGRSGNRDRVAHAALHDRCVHCRPSGILICATARRRRATDGRESGGEKTRLGLRISASSQPTTEEQCAKAKQTNRARLGNWLDGELNGIKRENGRVRVVVWKCSESKFCD